MNRILPKTSNQGIDGMNGTLTGEVSMTVTGQRSDLHCVPGVLQFCHVGYDGFNKALTGDTSMTVTAKRSDPHHVPCVISLAREAAGTASFGRCSIAFKRGSSVSRNGSSKSTRGDS